MFKAVLVLPMNKCPSGNNQSHTSHNPNSHVPKFSGNSGAVKLINTTSHLSFPPFMHTQRQPPTSESLLTWQPRLSSPLQALPAASSIPFIWPSALYTPKCLLALLSIHHQRHLELCPCLDTSCSLPPPFLDPIASSHHHLLCP